MQGIAHEIRSVVDNTAVQLARMTPEEVSAKPGPDAWSKKQILGHLIDSAANNHQRFVRAAANLAHLFPPYNQNEWVQIQRYDESEWSELIALWSALNRHLSDVIARMPESALSNPCNIGKDQPVPVDFVIRDYLRHLRHHVQQLFTRVV